MGSRQINVNSVSPGPTETPLFIPEKSEASLGLRGWPSSGGPVKWTTSPRWSRCSANPESKWVTGQNIGADGWGGGVGAMVRNAGANEF